MKISFDITSEEVDVIALQYGYDSEKNGDKDEFVLEQFKIFGRNCIESKTLHTAKEIKDAEAKVIVDSAKSAISF